MPVEALVAWVVFEGVEVLVEHSASPIAIAIALATAATVVRVALVLGTLGLRAGMACVCTAGLLSPPRGPLEMWSMYTVCSRDVTANVTAGGYGSGGMVDDEWSPTPTVAWDSDHFEPPGSRRRGVCVRHCKHHCTMSAACFGYLGRWLQRGILVSRVGRMVALGDAHVLLRTVASALRVRFTAGCSALGSGGLSRWLAVLVRWRVKVLVAVVGWPTDDGCRKSARVVQRCGVSGLRPQEPNALANGDIDRAFW